jgi:GNAT superfamily N-acetyltransferase
MAKPLLLICFVAPAFAPVRSFSFLACWTINDAAEGEPQADSEHYAMIPHTIRPYDAAKDARAAYTLWQSALGDVWPTTEEAFHKVLTGYERYEPGDHVVAVRGERLLGMIATQPHPHNYGDFSSIPLVMVAPEAQRQGIGTALLETVLERWAEEDKANWSERTVQLGAGGESYFWPSLESRVGSRTKPPTI